MPTVTFGDLNQSRRNNFSFIRFLLATVIIFAHSFGLVGSPHPDPFYTLTHGQTLQVGLAIQYFWLMSGFLITASWIRRRSTSDFFKRRILRLYPAVAVMSLLCVFVVGPLSVGHDLGAYFHQVSIRNYIVSVLMLKGMTLPGVFAGLPEAGNINGPLGSLGYQFRGYLVVALLGALGFYRRPRLVLAFFAVSYATFIAHTYGYLPVLSNTSWHVIGELSAYPRLLTYYGAGMLAFLYRDRIPQSRTLFLLALVLLCASFQAGLVFAAPVCASYLMFYVAFSPAVRLNNFMWGADYSYGLYIYAWPIQQLLVQYYRPHLTATTLFLAAWPLALLCAMASYHVIEARCMQRKAPRAEAPKPAPERVPEPAMSGTLAETASAQKRL